MYWRNLFVCYLLCQFPFAAIAQNNEPTSFYDHFTTDNGLSNNYISSIVQDQYGFIWIGTNNGLNRFDGYNFIEYKNDITDSNSISNNFIKQLFIDSRGFIWIATNNGLNRFDPATETFRRFMHQPGIVTSIASNQVSAVCEDEQGNIWVAAFKTLDRLDIQAGIFTHYSPPLVKNDYETHTIEALAFYNNDIFLSVWGVGPYRFNRETKNFKPIEIWHKTSRSQNWLNSFYVDKKGSLLGSDGVLLRYVSNNNYFALVDSDGAEELYLSITGIAETPDGKDFLIGTAGNGFYTYSGNLVYKNRSILDKDTTILFNNSITKILTAKTGEVWFGTFGNGLFKWNTNKKKFASFTFQPGKTNSVSKSNITTTCFTKTGQVWLGTRNDGIDIFDPSSQSFTHIKQSSTGLNSDFIRFIFEDRQGNKWIGTWGKGLNRMDAVTGAFSYFNIGKDANTTLQDNYVTSICQTPDNKIWVATTRGVSVIEGNTLIKSFVYEKGSRACPGGLRTDYILSDHHGDVWIGTDANGLSRYRSSTSTFDYFDNVANNQSSLGSNKINVLFEDSKNRLWISCSGSGLDLFEPAKQNFIHYTEKNGLPGNEVTGITEDKNGRLWVTTDKGLSHFDPGTNVFKNFNKEDGLLSNQFSMHAICTNAATGNIYAGTNKGLIAFHPDSIKSNPYIPPVYFISFKKYNTIGKETFTQYIKAISHLNRVELNYNENTFTVSFLSLNFFNSSKNQYAYRLKGLNNNWVSLGTIRELTFSKLPPGEYVLQIKASNNDLVWNETGTSLLIKIRPPWWLTWWAYLLYAIAITGLVYFFMWYTIRQQVLRRKELEKIRTKISSDLHDDVGTILSGLAMQSQMLTYAVKEELKEPLVEISSMSREAMEHMRDTVWAIDSRKDKYENLIDRMRDFAEKNLSMKKMTHEFIIADIDTKKFISPEKRQAIYLIFKEAITNIVKHCNGNHVVINFSVSKSGLNLIVQDNGEATTKSTSDGLGLGNMKMRAEKIGGTLTAKYEKGFVIELIV